MDNEINFEEFNIPYWAARLIGTDEDGYLIEYAQLMTRDGRRTGNAVIRKVEPLTEWVITVVTDMGNELVLTRGEAEELFFEPVYVMKADAVGVRLCRNATPDEPKTECTNSDTWNCKYCRKTQTCEALNDDRNFGGTVKPEPEDKTDYRCPYAKAMYEQFEKIGQFDTEEFGFAQELVSQYGGDYVDDDAEVFQITAKHLYVMMKVLGYGRLSEKQDKSDTVAASNGLKVNIEVLCDKLATARVALADAEANMKLLRDLFVNENSSEPN